MVKAVGLLLALVNMVHDGYFREWEGSTASLLASKTVLDSVGRHREVSETLYRVIVDVTVSGSPARSRALPTAGHHCD